MVSTSARVENDLTQVRWVSLLVWRLPIVVMVASGLISLDAAARGSLWALCLGVLGGGCVANALRCGRLHCYFTGPFFILMAAVSLLHGLGVVALGAGAWMGIGGATLVGALVLTFVPERIWGEYARHGWGAAARGEGRR